MFLSLSSSITSHLNFLYFQWLEGVDSSSPALDIARDNIVLNNFDSGLISFHRQDATQFMKSAISKGDLWDIVILDPPKLAPNRKVFSMLDFSLDALLQ